MYKYKNKGDNKIKEFTSLDFLPLMEHVSLSYPDDNNECFQDIRVAAKFPLTNDSFLGTNEIMKLS